jgi:hypothetical protein
MDIKDLNEWLNTDDGKAWIDGQKKPLIDKRDELLAALAKVNGQSALEAQRATENGKALEAERKAVERLILDDRAASEFKNSGVPDSLIMSGIEAMKKAHGLAIEVNGDGRKVVSKVTGKDVTPREVFELWGATPEGTTVLEQLRALKYGAKVPNASSSDRPFTLADVPNMTDKQILDNLPVLTKGN